jgi:class 3 adenylate cyclase/tetratricopeptide (TPR) repeat protein
MASVETVTILFTDLVGKTDLALRIGQEPADKLHLEHLALLREAIVAANGREVKSVGDGLMVAFSSAAAAVGCAAVVQQRTELRNRRGEHELGVRIGVSLGDAMREDGDYFGRAVVEAARLCALARGGQVLLADVIRVMVGRRGDHLFLPVGELELKGIPEPVAACELVWNPLPTAGLPLPPRLRIVPETAYVGRERLRARLSELWELARSGARQVALLAGEPGIGKTRLATHVALSAHAEGATVLYGRCDEELGAAYQPWVDALRGLVEHCPVEVLAEHVREHGGELSTLVPELSRRLPEVPEPRSTDPETERYLLFGAIAGLLERAAAEAPLVFLLDDLHWADKPSLALLKHVAAHTVEARLLLLGTYRDSDVTAADPLSALLADMRRMQGVDWLELSGLDYDEVRSLIEAAAGHDLDADGVRLAEAIERETDGNPFFVSEMLRHLVESGGVVQGSDGRYTVAARVGELGLPRSVRDVVGQRVMRLGGKAVRALSIGAVIGREFDFELLVLVADFAEDDLLEVLEAAVQGSVLRESSQSPGRFVFAHALINHTLYENLSRTRRGRLHRRVAEAIESLCGDDPAERLGELANHWSAATQAVDSAKAVTYARRAGERALQKLAPDEALRWFDQALEQLATVPDMSESERCELLILRGYAQRQAGEPGYRETLLEAGEIAERLADSNRMARAAIANSHGWYSGAGEIDEDRVNALEAALAAAPEDSGYRPRLLAQLASEIAYGRNFTEVRRLIDESLEVARRSDDSQTLAPVLSFVSSALIVQPDLLEERRRVAGELSRLADALGDPHWRFMGGLWQFFAAVDAADIRQVRIATERMREVYDATGQPWMRWMTLLVSASEAQLSGDLEQAEALATQAVVTGTEIGEHQALTYFGAQLGAVRFEQRRLEEIVDIIAQRADENPGLPLLQALVTFYYSEIGRMQEAAERLDAVAGEGFAGVPYDDFYLQTLTRYGHVSVRASMPEVSRDLYERLLPYRERLVNSHVTVLGSTEMILGRLAGAIARYDVAEQHFAAAADLHERIGGRLLLARTRLHWGEMLVSRGGRGDAERARALLDDAIAGAVALDGAAIEHDARALIARTHASA